MAKTRKDHVCKFCGKVIPKGTPMDEIYVETSEGFYPIGHRFGGYHWLGGKWRHRDYYHKDCAIMAELVKRRDKWMPDFFVVRSATEVTYVIGGKEEISIPLTNDLNKGVKKMNEIYLFAVRNNLTIYPELSLTSLQEED